MPLQGFLFPLKKSGNYKGAIMVSFKDYFAVLSPAISENLILGLDVTIACSILASRGSSDSLDSSLFYFLLFSV